LKQKAIIVEICIRAPLEKLFSKNKIEVCLLIKKFKNERKPFSEEG